MIDPSLLAGAVNQEGLVLLLQTSEERGGLGWPVDPDFAFEEIPEIAKGVKADGKVSLHRLIPESVEEDRLIVLAEFEKPYVRRDLRDLLGWLRGYIRTSGKFPDKTGMGDTVFIVASPGYEELRFVLFEENERRLPRIRSFGWRHEFIGRTVLTHNLERLHWQSRRVWERAWDVEALTEDFYKDYERTFRRMVRQVQGASTPKQADDWTQLLFNRLLFLAFIQRMGWLQTPNGTKGSFLFDLYRSDRPESRTFLGILGAVFNELDTKDDEASKGKFREIIGDVPYLNGGLFDRDDPLNLPGIHLPDEAFAELLGEPQGLFAKYNFTVTESTPLDQEVAVDPEMLGKIFERLIIAEERHKSGTYYTPRPIVEFMVNEALKGYLIERGLAPEKASLLVDQDKVETDELSFKPSEMQDALDWLFEVRAVDPACGSGAYLLMLLQRLFELVDRLEVVQGKGRNTDQKHLYETKLRLLQRCIYGVDLSDTAVRIARLRMWLSLVVENKGVKPDPLPNFDFLIMSGDSLASPVRPGQLVLIYPEAVREYAEMKLRFFHPSKQESRPSRLEMRVKREEIEKAYTAELAPSGLRRLANKPFDWEVDFAEVFSRDGSLSMGNDVRRPGFDIVLANPPYVNSGELLRALGSAYKTALVNEYPNSGSGTADLLVFFMDRALQLLRPGGFLAFITSNKWLKASYGKKLRSHLAKNSNVQALIDFRDLPVFQGTIAYPLITIAKKDLVERDLFSPRSSALQTRFVSVPSLELPYPDLHSVVELLGCDLKSGLIGTDGDWRLETGEGSGRLEKMRASAMTLGDYVDKRIYYGIKTGLNEAAIGDDGNIYGKSVPRGVRIVRKEGVFVINGKKRAELIAEDPRSDEIIRPLAVGKDIRRWIVVNRDRWLIVTKIGVDISRYPAVMRHLDKYKKLLISRGDQGDHWWELRACAYYEEFEAPRIVYQEIAGTPGFALAPAGLYVNNKVFMIASESLYLLAIVNSAVAWEFWREVSTLMVGGAVAMQTPTVFQLPIPTASDNDRAVLEKLASQILEKHQMGQVEGITVLEAEINARVEFLYFSASEAPTYDEWLKKRRAEHGTAVEELRKLIATGETGMVEFKQSLEYVDPAHPDILKIPEAQRQQKLAETRKAVIHSALKTICAFLNSRGGTLLIGVHDTDGPVGIEPDYALLGRKQDKDGFENKLTDLLKTRFKPIPTDLTISFIPIDGRMICRIDVPAESSAHFLDNKLYIRLGNSTEELTGRDFEDWLAKHRANFASQR